LFLKYFDPCLGCFSSNHPIDSFAIWGKEAKEIAASQPLTPAFGDESPLGVLIQHKGKVLLIGVGYDSCTLLHHAETKINDYPIKEYQTAMLVNGKREWSSYVDFDYTADRFNDIGDAFENQATLSIRKVGQATIRCIDANELDEFAIQYLTNNK
jgi:aminoglycoside 3-N-acetyltransferase